ncbi:MAG: 3-oxoacyl-ACP reductase FabG [Chloroflexi bacterium]|nr:3-oxoacyl-ACP reductase FabG [Chloroflexota bacterium]
MSRLDNQIAIVTGAAQGLGRAFCEKLAAEGAHVVAADLNLDGASATAHAIGGGAMALQVDVSQEASTARMAEETLARWGRIDILVNNAGIYQGLTRRSFEELPPGEWDRVMAVNLKGPWLCARAVVPAMKKQRRGKIINISSATFFSGSPLMAHYVASKAGVIGLTRAMAKEAGEYGICVNAVAPGFTLTEASRALRPDAETYAIDRGAIRRAEQPEDLVGLVAFLASSESDFITGQTIVVDGGRQLH